MEAQGTAGRVRVTANTCLELQLQAELRSSSRRLFRGCTRGGKQLPEAHFEGALGRLPASFEIRFRCQITCTASGEAISGLKPNPCGHHGHLNAF